MWDESAMRSEGYADLAKDRTEKPRETTGPATERGVRGEVAAKVAVSAELTGGHPALSKQAQPAGPSALSWVVTIILAVALGVGVFFVVRYLR